MAPCPLGTFRGRDRLYVHSPHQPCPQGSLLPKDREPGNEVESSLAAILQLVSNEPTGAGVGEGIHVDRIRIFLASFQTIPRPLSSRDRPVTFKLDSIKMTASSARSR